MNRITVAWPYLSNNFWTHEQADYLVTADRRISTKTRRRNELTEAKIWHYPINPRQKVFEWSPLSRTKALPRLFK